MDEIERLRKKRKISRAVVTKFINKVKAALEEHAKTADERKLKQLECNLQDNYKSLSVLDQEIMDTMIANDVDAEECIKEAEGCSDIQEKVTYSLVCLKDVLTKCKSETEGKTTSQERANSDLNSSIASEGSVIRRLKVNLPRLELKKFTGKVTDWQEFWDGFNSAIHEDTELANVDKFKYLKSFIEEPVSKVIAGIPLTDANYSVAVDLLEKRYAKPCMLKRAHLNELLNLPPVFNEKSIGRLRDLHDRIETQFRGLEALKVDKDSYSSVVVPVLMEKIPENIRQSMIRFSEGHLEWTVDKMITALAKEIEVRESHVPIFKPTPQQQIVNKPSKRSEFPPTAAALTTTLGKKCVFCQEDHNSEYCMKTKDPIERKNILIKYGKCFNCLGTGHRSFTCRSKGMCKHCKGGKHHVAICNQTRLFKDRIAASEDREPKQATDVELNPAAAPFVGQNNAIDARLRQRVALQTAIAKVNEANCRKVRVLFDSGSQRTFVTIRAAKCLGLEPVRREEMKIKAFGMKEAETKEREIYRLSLSPVFKSSVQVVIEAVGVEDISSIPSQRVESIKKSYAHLKHVYFSDFSRTEESLEIDILIGSDFLWEFHEGEIIRGGLNEPVAVKTSLGWTLSGPLKGKKLELEVCSDVIVNLLSEPRKQEIDTEIHRLWDLDSIGIRETNEIHQDVIDDIIFTGKRYSVGLPWKVGHRPLPTNYQGSMVRLEGQIRKLKKIPHVFGKYNDVIREQFQAGIIEQVSELEQTDSCHYLPHHAVCREDAETTKVRVVYDASAKDHKTGVSLNDCLHAGPALTPLIFDILLRFRAGKVALVGDIEKAFLNIEIHPQDRKYLRFLWIDNIKALEPRVVTYQFNRVVFGVTSSPFLLNAVLRYHLQTYSKKDQEFVKKMVDSFFVDDLVTSCDSIQEAGELYDKAKTRLAEGGFTLRKWKTNDINLASKIIESESKDGNDKGGENSYAKEIFGIPVEKGRITKVLGVAWNIDEDKIEVDLSKVLQNVSKNPTKRRILSTLGAVFDPLGLISPITVVAKMMFQELCVGKYGWDDTLPKDKSCLWESWLRDLSVVSHISLPRFVFEGKEDKVIRTSLHGFGDASLKGYCAMIFIERETTGGVHTSLLCAKTRVAPLKSLSIPRLELMSARILVTLMETVKNAISSHIRIDELRYWLDSKTALFWINNNGEWKTFVQHRVNEILKRSQKEKWGHVAGTDNPADLGSRGVTAGQLVEDSKWWLGPSWLRKGKGNWPKSILIEDSDDIGSERKKTAIAMIVTKSDVEVRNVIDIQRYSSFNKVLRVTAYVRRFIVNLIRKRESRELLKDRLSVEEIREAEGVWIKDAQSSLRHNPDFKQCKEQLGVVSENGILICKGRLEHSELDIEAKYPIILPRNNKITEMIVMECHERVHHCKVKGTLAEIRSRFWITKGRQYVKKVIRNCFICKKWEGKPYSAPAASALPDFRVTKAPPFSKVGVDFAGPLYIKVSKNVMSKAYIVLFTCCVTRALHLELATDLKAETFVNCLRRFCSRRGTPTLIVSDNAKTFKATSNLLRTLEGDESVSNLLDRKRITWRFNLERSPWMGGFFERMVQSVKRCLRKVLGNAKLSLDELSAVLAEVESTLNSRPLTYEYETEQVLTPSHLIFGRRLSPVSWDIGSTIEPEQNNTDSLCKRFLYLSRKLDHFWNRWKSEYLTDLREQHKLEKSKPISVAEGEVVLLHDDNSKRGQWKVGVIERLVVGKDGQVRGASVRTTMQGKGKLQYLNRPLQKLFPLEITSVDQKSEQKVEEPKKGEVGVANDERGGRATRVAAKTARIKTRLMLDS